MPIQPTYPGVYIEEIPSGVRTLTGVATSITAFIGSALRGPVDHPVLISSYADFERAFGGLWVESDMSYAVRDFFLNGGSQAVIVRVFNIVDPADATGDTTDPGVATVALDDGQTTPTDVLTLEAASPGEWGNALVAIVDGNVSDEIDQDERSKFFNLTLRDPATGNEEVFRNVTVDAGYAEHPGYLEPVLANRSNLARVTSTTGVRPADTTETDPDTGELITAAWSGGNNGFPLVPGTYEGNGAKKTGLYALEKADLFNLLCIPDILDIGALATAAKAYCEKRRAMLIIDSPESWDSVEDAKTNIAGAPSSTNAAIFFPRLMQPDPLRDGQIVSRPACGAVAGVIARTDGQRGLWKAPAGLDATLSGVPKLSQQLTDDEIGQLNPLGINCLKNMPAAGRVVWGARTRKGDDRLASEWKYIPVRRLALYIEESLYRGTQWVVFEPNDEPLWAQIRLNVGAFMNGLFRKGAFQGSSPSDAYFVKCDKESTTQADINLGIVNIVVGFAPLKPAEFVIIKLQQMAGQVAA